jgi:galactokinase
MNVEAIVERLSISGMSGAALLDKATLFSNLLDACAVHFRRAGPPLAMFVPGRIEVLGKHTDYCGGRSLLAAAERGICLLAAARGDARLHIFDVVRRREFECEISPHLEPPADHWSNYVMTAVRRLARNFPALRGGAELAFASDLPSAAGMSSSSALIVAVALALARVTALDQDAAWRSALPAPEALASYLACVENGQSYGALAGDRGVGTLGGSEDHTAMLCCHAGRLAQYSFCPTRRERDVPVPPGYGFVIAVSGVRAEKTGPAREKYNRASRAARHLLGHWRAVTRRSDTSLADAVRSAPDAADRLREIAAASADSEFSPAWLLDRFEHFREESERLVPAASASLERSDLRGFAAAAAQSQETAERLLGNQVPQTILLARLARECGAAASSSFGAGFGGSVWAMVREEEQQAFTELWQRRYLEAYPELCHTAQFFWTSAGPAVVQI